MEWSVSWGLRHRICKASGDQGWLLHSSPLLLTRDRAAPSRKLRRSIQGVGWSDWSAEICSDPETCSSPCLFSVTNSCHLDFYPYSLLTGCYDHFCTFSCSCYYCLCTLHWYSCLQHQEQRFLKIIIRTGIWAFSGLVEFFFCSIHSLRWVNVKKRTPVSQN